LAVRSSIPPVLTTTMRQTIRHSITDIMAAAADVMDMEQDKNKDRAEDSISRILSVRRPRFRESSYKVSARFCSATWLGQIRFSGKSGGRKERWAFQPRADAQSGR
jgi:hypothetical protein